MRIRWTRAAAHQLEFAHACVAADNPSAADRLLTRIIQGVNALGEYPLAGREGRVKGTREFVVVNTPYIVAYRVAKSTIQVLALLHARQKWPEHF